MTLSLVIVFNLKSILSHINISIPCLFLHFLKKKWTSSAFVCRESLYLFLISVGQIFWVQYYGLAGFCFFFQHFKYVILLSPGLHGFCWCICWYSYGEFSCIWWASLLLLLSKYSVFDFWQFDYNVSLWSLLWVETIWRLQASYTYMSISSPDLWSFQSLLP